MMKKIILLTAIFASFSASAWTTTCNTFGNNTACNTQNYQGMINQGFNQMQSALNNVERRKEAERQRQHQLEMQRRQQEHQRQMSLQQSQNRVRYTQEQINNANNYVGGVAIVRLCTLAGHYEKKDGRSMEQRLNTIFAPYLTGVNQQDLVNTFNSVYVQKSAMVNKPDCDTYYERFNH
ncbi:MAG: hypothetical protein HWE31_10085 [Vibrio campbellii]|nr:hypothetical protein [Vibrio campbellii]